MCDSPTSWWEMWQCRRYVGYLANCVRQHQRLNKTSIISQWSNNHSWGKNFLSLIMPYLLLGYSPQHHVTSNDWENMRERPGWFNHSYVKLCMMSWWVRTCVYTFHTTNDHRNMLTEYRVPKALLVSTGDDITSWHIGEIISSYPGSLRRNGAGRT